MNLIENIPLANPLSVHIETVNKCNFSCVYCPESYDNYGDLVGGFRSLTLNEFELICGQLKQLGKVSVVKLWIMGEPLLNPNLGKMIKMLKDFDGEELCERIEVTTNGSALTQKRITELLETPLDKIFISIYGIGEQHRKITQSAVSDLKILENVALLKTMRDAISDSKLKIICKTVDPLNDAELHQFVKRYEPLADEIEVKISHSWIEGGENSILRNVFDSTKINLIQGSATKEKISCPFPFYTVAIHANGDVSPCCVDWEKKVAVGNVFETPLKEIWNGAELKSLQVAHLSGKKTSVQGCKNCEYFQRNCNENLDDSRQIILKRLETL